MECVNIKTEDIVKIGKALSDPKRVEILKLLSNNELCACKLLEHFDITQPTLSHHMKKLNESKLINTTKKGTGSYYTINADTINEFKEFLNEKLKEETINNDKNCGCK